MMKLIDFENEYNKRLYITNLLFVYKNTLISNSGKDYCQQLLDNEVKNLIYFLTSNYELLAKNKSTDEIIQRKIKLLEKEVNSDFSNFYQEINACENDWYYARKENKFEIVKESFNNLIDCIKSHNGFVKGNPQCYQQLLSRYIEDFSYEEIDGFFDGVKKIIVPYIKMNSKAKDLRNNNYKIAELDICKLETWLKAKKENYTVHEGEYTYSVPLAIHDTHIFISKYDNEKWSSFLHEYGHMLYTSQIKEEYENTVYYSITDQVFHESQALLFEFMIGRNKTFWKCFFEKFFENTKYKNDDFLISLNQIIVSPIRGDSDYLTYLVHILIRYEIEKEIFINGLTVEKLNKIWKEKYKKYLNIDVTNDNEGILQDNHWFCGYFGYFPSYLISFVIAMFIFIKLDQQLSFKKICYNQDFDTLYLWLKENYHKYGSSKSIKELLASDFDKLGNIDDLFKKILSFLTL